jgi:Na+/melibiose symporter-like transporter
MNKVFLIRIGITALVFWILDSLLMYFIQDESTLAEQMQESLFKAILFSIVFGLIMRKKWMKKKDE